MPGAPKGSSSSFLPAQYGGTAIGRPDAKSKDRAWDNLCTSSPDQRQSLDLVQAMNKGHLLQTADDRALEAEIQNMELAFRMQSEAPDLMSLDGESEATRALYGIGEDKTDDFGRRLPDGPAICRERRPLYHPHALHPRVRQPVGPAQGFVRRASQQRRGSGCADRRPLTRPQIARHAGRHAGHVRQRIWPHACL